jgi:hypothetical protein
LEEKIWFTYRTPGQDFSKSTVNGKQIYRRIERPFVERSELERVGKRETCNDAAFEAFWNAPPGYAAPPKTHHSGSGTGSGNGVRAIISLSLARGARNQLSCYLTLSPHSARDLREYLKNLGRTARTLENDHPGISPTFRLPESGSYPALIAKTEAVIAAATPLQAAFVDTGLPATFPTELQALLTAFENATNQKHDGSITHGEGGQSKIHDSVPSAIKRAEEGQCCRPSRRLTNGNRPRHRASDVYRFHPIEECLAAIVLDRASLWKRGNEANWRIFS